MPGLVKIPSASTEYQARFQRPSEQIPTVEAFRWTEETLITLQRSYVFLSDGPLIANVLAQVPALYPLLNAAVKPLCEIFGESKVLQLEALTSDDDTVLRVIVKVSRDIENPAALMRKFKADWWFGNCAHSEASLVFDYEISNGF